MEKINPVIIGISQYTQHRGTNEPLDPLNLMIKISQEALIDTGTDGLNKLIDSICVINNHSLSYKDAPSEISNRLEIDAVNKNYTPIGGNAPQMAVNQAAKDIALGKSQAILITGGEAEYTASRIKKGKISLNWPKGRRPIYPNKERYMDFTPFEQKYNLIIPTNFYAIFETALRAASGRSLEEHTYYVGNLLERCSKIAAENPYSWNQEYLGAEEIITPTSENRVINHPYVKWMTANFFVDQSAALIMVSEKVAKDLDIDRNQWIYPMGGADLNNVITVTRRPNFHDSPAIRKGHKLALRQAGLKIDDINIFDLYSCFPCMIEIARREMGIDKDDPRNLTITGGLPYFGGPFNSYSLHAIVTAVEKIRANPSLKIMILANGGYNTKQSIGVYGNEPPSEPWGTRDDSITQQSIYEKELPEPIIAADGDLYVEAYTITYNREGQPEKGIVIGRINNGRRTVANIEAKPEILSKLARKELVGKTFKVQNGYQNGRNLILINGEIN
jgi:acetyl-CoA C-acetyltransferase